MGFITCSTLSCDMEKRHGIIPKISFPTDKLQREGLKLHSVKDNLLRMNTCMMLSAILMQLPDLMTGLRKGLYQATICRSASEPVASKQRLLTFPPGWAFSSDPGCFLTAAFPLPRSANINTRKQKIGKHFVFEWVSEVCACASAHLTLGSPRRGAYG